MTADGLAVRNTDAPGRVSVAAASDLRRVLAAASVHFGAVVLENHGHGGHPPPMGIAATSEAVPDRFVERAEQCFERLSPYRRPGFRNHCLRLHQFARQLLVHHRVVFPDGIAQAIALFHDLGLFATDVEGDNYLERSAALFARATADLPRPPGLTDERLRECLVYNHRLTRPPGLSVAAECFRQAVWVEHSRGILRFGLPRLSVRRVFQDYPRDDFSLVLLDFGRRVLTAEPLTIVDGIFLGGR